MAKVIRNLIHCEHFLYGMGVPNYLQKTSGVNKLLNEENLYLLSHVGDNVIEETYFQTWFPTEKLLAVSRVHPLKDEYGRKGVWNHTILISISDYIRMTQPPHIFASYFIKTLDDSERLQPILIEESK